MTRAGEVTGLAQAGFFLPAYVPLVFPFDGRPRSYFLISDWVSDDIRLKPLIRTFSSLDWARISQKKSAPPRAGWRENCEQTIADHRLFVTKQHYGYESVILH